MKCRLPIAECRMVAWVCGALLLAGCGAGDTTAPSDELYSVRVSIHTNQITVGDLVRVQVDAVHPEDARVEWPEWAEQEPLVLRDRQTETRALEEGRARSTRRYTITSFRVGDHLLATGVVRFVEADEVVERPFPETTLHVLSSLADDEFALSPNKPLLTWPGRLPRWVWVLAGIALLAVILGALAARFLSQPRTILHQPPPRPAHETALNALRLLLTKRYIEEGHIELFYTELSSIVRHYIEDRFQLRAPELTTEEFIREASTARVLNAEHQSLVNAFLEQSDLVKFARFRPGEPEMKDAYAAAERLVHETIPAPSAPGTEGGRA